MASYIVVKHSWKGKYKRVLVIEPNQISTFDPKTMKLTNVWPYDEVLDVAPLNGDLFKILTRKKTGNTDMLKFSSEFRKDILCDIISFRPQNFQTEHDKHPTLQYEGSKFHWTRQELPAILELRTNAIVQTDSLGNAHAHYYYKHIGHIALTSNPPGCVCIAMSGFGRLHLFRLTNKMKSNIRDPDRLVDDFIKSLQTYAVNNCGISFLVKKDPLEISQFYSSRFGPKYSTDEALTSLHEFTVYKLHQRHGMRPVRRILCITNLALVERNPDTYQPVTVKPLYDIFSLIRSAEDPQIFSIEFASLEKTFSYTSTERDALLASLVESVRSSGNVDVHVKITRTNLSWRCGPLHIPVDDEIERGHLKAFVSLPVGWTFLDAIYRFNTICPYSGLAHNSTQDVKLFSENKAKLIIDALKSFLDQTEDGGIPMFYAHNKEMVQQAKIPADIEQYFQTLRRLVASKPGYAFFNQSERFRAYLGASIVETIKLNNDAITYAGFDVLCALMQPMHPDCDIRHEQLNKSSLLATKKFLESLLDVLKLHINRGTGALVVSSMLDFLTYALCAPYSETTDSSCFDTLLNLIAANGRDIYKLFQHPSLAIVKGAGLVIKAIILEGEPNVSKRMQELSLAEGALMKHLHIGLFSQFKDGRTLGVQFLSRHLVALWSIGSEETKELFRRMFPLGLLNYLDSTEKPPESMISMPARDNLHLANQTSMVDNSLSNTLNSIKDIHPSVRILERQLEQTILHWREQIGMPKRDDKLNARPVVLRKCRQRVKVEDNWDMFYYQFYQDHCKPDLIWNLKTREELKTVIENELRQFMTDRELAAKQTLISWNYHEFEVIYKSLADEIKIGDYFLRLLLEDSDNLMQKIQIKSPFHFLSDLYHRFLLNKRVDMRCTCLHAMSIIYENYMQEIGHFNDIVYIVEMLKDCKNRLERDRLVLLLEKFVMHKANAKDFIDAGGVETLVDMITLAHLHTQRAFIPTQTNVIEATTEMLAAAASKEWYYSNDDKLVSTERPDEDSNSQNDVKPQSHQGPFRFAEIEEMWQQGKVDEKTKFWSQGMNGWRLARDISQMKWCIMSTGNSMMNESELATCILNIFIQICEYYPSHDLDGAIIRPFPRIKKYLSDTMCLPHIVQLLVTFDPVIVERVSTLLLLIIEENPMISQLYRSGLFFFILMYSGSNLLPIGRLLHATHLAQAFRIDESSKSKVKSFLTYLLPDAMVCFLENHGPDRFAQIFLGEFDTPEAIWNGEMRRNMIEKIACHVADFTSRLKSNNRATYDYCPIAPITYEQLEDELFVDIYYLRNLCNTSKFQNWPIKDPVNLLKALLDAWKEEASREPSTLSLEDALKVLKLNPENYKHPEDIDEQIVKRAYRDLALKYHPDKNPDGAHIFQEIHKAYEFLSSKQARERASGSNPKNLILIFKSQSILFSQCRDELHPYKYSGYPMLIETIKNEVEDDRLFSKPDPMLAYACETAFHTLRCSSKNAEELRREAGLEVLQQALSRCASVLSASSNPEDVCVQMCFNIVKCFTVASEFEACQQKLSELHSVIKDLNRILSYGKLIDLQLAAAECAAAFAKCPPLHEILFQSGIVFSLLLLLFKYDYTLEEGGVERNEGHNKQETVNNIARIALYACVRLYELNHSIYGRSIEAMLSHYIASFFIESSLNPHDLLKMLTSNVEIPYLIWDNSTRAELVDYLEAQQKGIIQSGECPDESYGANFEITSQKSELRVGNIFIRIYNSQPSYPLRDAPSFVQALLDYVGSQSQYIHSALSLSNDAAQDTSAYQSVECCLKALALAIKFNPGVEVRCIGYFKLLFSLLMIDQLPNVQDMALHVIKNITSNGQCVKDIGDSDVLVYLWMILYSSRSSLATNASNDKASTQSPSKKKMNDRTAASDTINNIYHGDDPVSRTLLILDIFMPLIANAQLVKETISKGGLVHLVDLFCNCTDETIRLRSSDLMARVTVDKLSGFQATLILNRFLPMIIVDAMKNSAKDAIGLFDNNQENPELIWNTEMRQHIKASTSNLCKEIYEEQVKNPGHCWQMPQDFNLLNATNQEELVVAGVYLRLFNQNPTWVLRKPRDFLTELMNTFQALIKSATINESKLESVTQALKNLLSAQPALLELIPAMGHVHSIVSGIYSQSNKNQLVSKSCLTILSELGSSRACVDNMSTRDTLLNEIKSSMINIPETVDIACFGLRKIYEFAPVNGRIVQQALEANFITYLLEVLNSNHSAQTRALIVKVLKSMTTNPTYGLQVETILGKSQTWSEYSDQKHDLFISNEPSLVAIAAPTANIAGYLQYNTQSPAQPPPVDK